MFKANKIILNKEMLAGEVLQKDKSNPRQQHACYNSLK